MVVVGVVVVVVVVVVVAVVVVVVVVVLLEIVIVVLVVLVVAIVVLVVEVVVVAVVVVDVAFEEHPDSALVSLTNHASQPAVHVNSSWKVYTLLLHPKSRITVSVPLRALLW